MGQYISNFDTTAEFATFSASTEFRTPHVTMIKENEDVMFFEDSRLVVKFNVTDTTNPTKICHATSAFSEVEIDGFKQESVTTGYTFETTGEHAIKYVLANITTIGESAFTSCSAITEVTIPSNVTSIGHRAFYGCKSLTNMIIPNTVTNIGGGIFSGCTSLTSVSLPNSITKISYQMFSDCSGLTSVIIPSSVTLIDAQAFIGCNGLTSIEIPNSVTAISGSSFMVCTSLTSITIPDSVTIIDYGVFQLCSGLTSVTIGSGVTTIGDACFAACFKLQTITCNATTAPTISNNTFNSVKSGGTLYVPTGSSGYNTWISKLSGWTKVEQ